MKILNTPDEEAQARCQARAIARGFCFPGRLGPGSNFEGLRGPTGSPGTSKAVTQWIFGPSILYSRGRSIHVRPTFRHQGPVHCWRNPAVSGRDNVAVVVTSNDVFAHHVTRLSGDDVNFDPIENSIVALQRAGILDRVQAVRLQARYLRESRP